MAAGGPVGLPAARAVPMFGPLAAGAPAQSRPPSTVDDAPGKARVVVLSDIGNEPDDQIRSPASSSTPTSTWSREM